MTYILDIASRVLVAITPGVQPGWFSQPQVDSLSLLFSSGQTAVRLYGAEAANRAQCAAFDKPVGY